MQSNIYLSVGLVFALGCRTQNPEPATPTPATTDPAPAPDVVQESPDATAVVAQDAGETPAIAAADVAAIPPTPTADTHVGLRAITFRPGARPPRSAAGAHGATAWTVLLAADTHGTSLLQQLFQHATTTLHLAAAIGDPNCSSPVGGAYPSTIPSSAEAQLLTVNFRSERDARAFAAALTETPPWIGRVRISCAD